MLANKIKDELIRETRRRLIEESVPRIKKCLAQCTEAEIWFRPNAATVSIGNLVLHLCGNVRQWILSGLGGNPDSRTRPAEFAASGPLPSSDLETMLDDLMQEVEAVLVTLNPEDLVKTYSVQGFEESGMSILVHVVEHFSYHTGQITWAVKSRKNVDMGYYPDIK